MATIDLTSENFEDTVKNNELVIVDFWAAWCGPCTGFAPVFENASEKHSDVVFGKVNTEEQRELAAAFDVRAIPFVVLLREAVIVFAQDGALPLQGIESIIGQARALDMPQIHREIAEQQSASAEGGDR